MAAGLGTRLKPWTLTHPKALVPVEGVPALERLIMKLKSQGFTYIVVNVHHFAGQVRDFLATHDFGIRVEISDESECLLDTGGALVRASDLLNAESGPVLIHNVDIVSNVDAAEVVGNHEMSGNDITLVTSPRASSRRLLFDGTGKLKGWHNLNSGEYRPAGFVPESGMREMAFSGIYVLGNKALDALARYSRERDTDVFPIMDFLLSSPEDLTIKELYSPELQLLDIGKPETLEKVPDFLNKYGLKA